MKSTTQINNETTTQINNETTAQKDNETTAQIDNETTKEKEEKLFFLEKIKEIERNIVPFYDSNCKDLKDENTNKKESAKSISIYIGDDYSINKEFNVNDRCSQEKAKSTKFLEKNFESVDDLNKNTSKKKIKSLNEEFDQSKEENDELCKEYESTIQLLTESLEKYEKNNNESETISEDNPDLLKEVDKIMNNIS